MEEYTEEAIQQMLKDIDSFDHVQMARLYRFAPSGSPYFRSDLPLHEHFMRRFQQLGGMTPTVSKLIGWDN